MRKKVARVDVQSQVPTVGTTAKIASGDVPAPAKKKRGRGMVIPPEIVHLLSVGHVYASERAEHGWLPQMSCALCGGPTDMIWLHDTIDDPLHYKGVLPGTVWGTDVAVLCRCCSLPGCSHREQEQKRA